MKMKSKIVIFRACVITACFLCILGFEKLFCEEPDKSIEKNDTAKVNFEQALKNHDAQKQSEQEELIIKLNFRLGQATENWINTAKKDKVVKLNTRLEQEWEKLSLFPPGHYEYYLKGYKYEVVKSDVIKTDSLVSFYKAAVIVQEVLYVEKNHPPNISDINPYFYTVSTNYTLNFEYKNEKFILTSSDSKIVSSENDCPDEFKKFRL